MNTKETFLTIDPPSGWKYGFPKAVTQEQYKLITDLKQWCIDNGYPKEEAHSYGDYFHIQINGDLSFINEDKSTRKQAMTWWNNLSDISIQMPSKSHLCKKYHGNMRIHRSLTDREIEEIWLKETFYTLEETKENIKKFKSNQKQFKTFDDSLHKAYLNKFSEEDKFKAFISNLNELSEEIQFNAFLATLRKMKLDSQTQSNIMTLVALKDI